MKIYPSTHSVTETEQLSVDQIPLAYIDTGTDSGAINIWRERAAAKMRPKCRPWK